MSESGFDLFCPQCNILIESKIIAVGNGVIHSNSINQLDKSDAQFTMDHYYLCICPRCDQPFLIKQSIIGVSGEYEIVSDETLLYPNESKIFTEELPQSVKTAYDQAAKALHTSLFESAVLMSRKCLEAICKIFNSNGRNLNQRLATLYKNGHIDSRLYNWANEIRLIGNEAAHDFDTKITSEDARDVFEFTEAILIYIFSLTKRFESLKARRYKKD